MGEPGTPLTAAPLNIDTKRVRYRDIENRPRETKGQRETKGPRESWGDRDGEGGTERE